MSLYLTVKRERDVIRFDIDWATRDSATIAYAIRVYRKWLPGFKPPPDEVIDWGSVDRGSKHTEYHPTRRSAARRVQSLKGLAALRMLPGVDVEEHPDSIPRFDWHRSI